MIMADKIRPAAWRRLGGQPSRLARLLIGRNTLRRPSDRLEGLIVVLLAAVFLAATVAAPCLGMRLYQSQRADATRLHQATAILTESGPAANTVASGQVTARWRVPDGQRRSGTLTTATAPGIAGASTGSRVRVWLTGAGRPEDPPAGTAEAVTTSVVFVIGAVCGTAIVLLICYWLGRLALDRRRLARWASEWSLIGPGWTTRR
jgi:hypothetical protein